MKSFGRKSVAALPSSEEEGSAAHVGAWFPAPSFPLLSCQSVSLSLLTPHGQLPPSRPQQPFPGSFPTKALAAPSSLHTQCPPRASARCFPPGFPPCPLPPSPVHRQPCPEDLPPPTPCESCPTPGPGPCLQLGPGGLRAQEERPAAGRPAPRTGTASRGSLPRPFPAHPPGRPPAGGGRLQMRGTHREAHVVHHALQEQGDGLHCPPALVALMRLQPGIHVLGQREGSPRGLSAPLRFGPGHGCLGTRGCRWS